MSRLEDVYGEQFAMSEPCAANFSLVHDSNARLSTISRIALDSNLSAVKRCFAARFDASFEIEREGVLFHRWGNG